MLFFIPLTHTASEAEGLLASIAQFVHRPVPPIDVRLRKITYLHNGNAYTAEVGRTIAAGFRAAGPVYAIFSGNPLLLCLRARGVFSGAPIRVAHTNVIEAVFFDEL